MKVCPGGHQHGYIQGADTALTAYHPIKMVKSLWLTWEAAMTEPVKDIHEYCQYLHLKIDDDPEVMTATTWSGEEPSAQEIEKAQAWLIHLHKAAGHPSNRNLVRSIKDAGKPTWLVKMATDPQCRACEELKEGDRLIPPASLKPPPRPWEFIGMDVTELTDFKRNIKMKVLLVMDLGSHLVQGDELIRLTLKGKTPETTAMVMEAVLRIWLVDKPKPK